jgi:hypothetical protein
MKILLQSYFMKKILNFLYQSQWLKSMHSAQLTDCLKDQRHESAYKLTSKLIAWHNKIPTNIVTKLKWLDTYASQYGTLITLSSIELVINQKSWYVNLTHTNNKKIELIFTKIENPTTPHWVQWKKSWFTYKPLVKKYINKTGNQTNIAY